MYANKEKKCSILYKYNEKINYNGFLKNVWNKGSENNTPT
jgi:hypothetical protein